MVGNTFDPMSGIIGSHLLLHVLRDVKTLARVSDRMVGV